MDMLKFFGKPKLRHPVMIVTWEADAGQLGPGITDYIRQDLGGEPFCEIDPIEFFPLNGVNIENDMVYFPQSTFYAFPEHDLILFNSTIPRYKWFQFFNCIIDVAQEHFHAKEFYSVGGMISYGPHTNPRDFWATFSSPQIKKSLSKYELSREFDFETPPGNRPTLNSFLLWAAKQRNLNGANLWVPIPFYLIASDDPPAQKRVLEFLDHRLGLKLNLAGIEKNVTAQNEKIGKLRREMTEIDRIINKLENKTQIAEDEHQKLVKEITEHLRK